MSQRVLITGHRGYIGSVLAPRLLERGYEVIGVDAGYFDACALAPSWSSLREWTADIRDLSRAELRGFDAVVHLAALSNDPLGELNPAWTEEINTRAAIRLAELARQAGVARFVFSSSCILYGDAGDAEVDETSPPDPRTVYARSKGEAERGIAGVAGPGFSPVFLRNGTVWGFSPRMRLDTVVNNLTASALATGRITIHSDGRPWRPVVHVEDVAAAFAAALEAPAHLVHNQAINVGDRASNRTVREVARVVAAAVPGSMVEQLALPGADQRSYRARFDKIAALLPGFRLRRPLEDGIAQLVRDLAPHAGRAFADPRFTRQAWLKRLIASGAVDANLRPAGVAA